MDFELTEDQKMLKETVARFVDNDVIHAVCFHGGRMRPGVVAAKTIASVVTIGSGGSAGRLGPVVHASSAVGSAIGRTLGLSSDRTRRLVAAGAASGIAALFNAPIAGLFFALEVILVRFGWADALVVFLSSSVAGILALRFYGNASLWRLILEANRSRLRRPADLRPGMQLIVPPRDNRRGSAQAAGAHYARASPRGR